MNRRSTAVSGMVNFPINDPQWTSSGEGGMFVRLLVVDPSGIGDSAEWLQCCGGDGYFFMDETLLWDDKYPPPSLPDSEDFEVEALMDHKVLLAQWEESTFPCLNQRDNKDPLSKNLSIPCLVVMTIGSTGWSGWDGNEYWHCAVNDLTTEGQRLYGLLQQTYPNCELRLQTWLDT